VSETRLRWLCVALVLLALLPLWAGRYPPLFDYPAHLLAAKVVTRYADPGAGYAEGYQLNTGWYLRSNALATLLIIGLAQQLPIELAGRLVLSLCLVLFIVGLWRLLRQAGVAWPLLLLGPPLAWNIGFTSGWLNFSLGLALGLHMLASFLAWSDRPRRKVLLLIVLLSGLIAAAHVVAWALWAVVIALLAAFGGLAPRRALALLLALALPLALALALAPALALALALSPALAWLAAQLARRLGLSPGALCLAAPSAAMGCYFVASQIQPWLQAFDPELTYVRFARTSFLLRTFSLAQQADPPDLLLHGLNIGLLACLALLALLLAAAALRRPGLAREPWLAALAGLIVIYGLIPSGTGELQIIEPRVLIIAALLGLAFVRLPQALALRRLAGGLAALACVFWLAGACQATLDYNRRALSWQADLALLGPARRVLAFRSTGSPPERDGWLLNYVNSRYDGSFFSSYRFIEQGGYTTRIFGNGPIWLRDDVPGWVFYRPQPSDAPGHLEEQCRLARSSFDAVLVWGAADAELNAMLGACFGPPTRRGDLTVWLLGGGVSLLKLPADLD
jgi:hypothetical protein